MSAPDFPGRSMPFDDVPLRGDFRDMTEQMILRLREAFEEEALLEEGEDADAGVLPRYLARYALTLDREAVKGTADEEEAGE